MAKLSNGRCPDKPEPWILREIPFLRKISQVTGRIRTVPGVLISVAGHLEGRQTHSNRLNKASRAPLRR